MTDEKPDPTSDAARAGNDADKDREVLKKQAEERLRNAEGKLPKDDV